MRSLFNAADDCLAPFIGIQEFNESLLLNILFQEQVIVGETYFFNSTLIAQHVQGIKGYPSLFEAAAREGIVVPVFRDPDVVSLRDARQRMKSYYGKDFEVVSPALVACLERIISSVDEGRKRTNAAYWPAKDDLDLGESYELLIRSQLQTDEMPACVSPGSDREALFRRVWDGSKRWRFDCVEEAVKKTRAKGSNGLQRLELMSTFGRRFGVLSPTNNVLPTDILARCDGETRLVAEIFMKWITQIHQLNYARAFDSSVNFPVYNLEQDFILDTIHRSPLDEPPPGAEGFRCGVYLPPIHLLASRPPNELIAIRRELGLAYTNSLARWRDHPSGDNQEVVKACLKDYCQQICDRYECEVRQPLLADIGYTERSPVEYLRDTVIAAVTDSFTGLFVQAWKGTRAAYSYTKAQQLKSQTEAQHKNLEVTLPSA